MRCAAIMARPKLFMHTDVNAPLLLCDNWEVIENHFFRSFVIFFSLPVPGERKLCVLVWPQANHTFVNYFRHKTQSVYVTTLNSGSLKCSLNAIICELLYTLSAVQMLFDYALQHNQHYQVRPKTSNILHWNYHIAKHFVHSPANTFFQHTTISRRDDKGTASMQRKCRL